MLVLRWVNRHVWSIIGALGGGFIAGLATALAGVPIGPFGLMAAIVGGGVGRHFDEGRERYPPLN